MALCTECGVELDDQLQHCPLCGTAVGTAPSGRAADTAVDVAEAPDALAEETTAVRVWLWEVVTLLAATVAVVVVGVDLAFGLALTWSVYALTSIAAFWLVTMALLFLAGRLLLLIPALAVVTVAVLLPDNCGLPNEAIPPVRVTLVGMAK